VSEAVASGPSSSPATPSPATPSPAAPSDRQPNLVIARVHLRLGSLGLARAELETLAGRNLLDDDAIRDLAEARWRTGDLAGAGEAAVAYLESHPDDVLALVIAAEAQADLGRPSEARRLAAKALEQAGGSLDPLFAGMPRSQVWPVDPGAAALPAGVLFDDLHPGPLPTAASGNGSAGAGASDPVVHEPLDPGVPAAIVGGQSLWGDDDEPIAPSEPLDSAALFHAGRVAVEAGRIEDAATALILALRAAPGLAPAVLDVLAGRGEALLVLVRGDAQRIVGREAEALRDHATAASGLGSAGSALTDLDQTNDQTHDHVQGQTHDEGPEQTPDQTRSSQENS
jgi:tetratricopeptide (TPR) repeat protein